MYGRISKYFPDRGFGFIAGEDGNRYFVHCTKLNGEYVERGYYVHFTPFRNERSGYNAKNISVVEIPERSTAMNRKRNNNGRKHKACNADKLVNNDKSFRAFTRRFMAEQRAV